jgi:hypothetical protein
MDSYNMVGALVSYALDGSVSIYQTGLCATNTPVGFRGISIHWTMSPKPSGIALKFIDARGSTHPHSETPPADAADIEITRRI